MTTVDAKLSKSRRFYYSMSLASCSVPVLQRILDLLPPRPNPPVNMAPPHVQICQRIWTPPPPPPPHQTLILSSVCIIFGNYTIFWGVKSAEDHFFPPTSGSRDLRSCFASQISHAKHHLFPDSSEKIPVSDGNDRQLLF